LDGAYNKMGECLIAVAVHASNFPLVVAANRDESYERPTLPADFWTDHPHILGGRDAVHGGTWLAISTSGRFAAVTNLRGSAPDAQKRSRGELVRDFVLGRESPHQYLERVAMLASEYAGFHLLASDVETMVQLSGGVQRLPPGVHALSNAPAGERWPKVDIAEARMRDLVTIENPLELIDEILQFLAQPRGTGRVESEVFVAGDQYGTRSSTALVVTRDRVVHFSEQSYGRGGIAEGEPRRFTFAAS
jgi:uncharacterized protein with NRDE domain